MSFAERKEIWSPEAPSLSPGSSLSEVALSPEASPLTFIHPTAWYYFVSNAGYCGVDELDPRLFGLSKNGRTEPFTRTR